MKQNNNDFTEFEPAGAAWNDAETLRDIIIHRDIKIFSQLINDIKFLKQEEASSLMAAFIAGMNELPEFGEAVQRISIATPEIINGIIQNAQFKNPDAIKIITESTKEHKCYECVGDESCKYLSMTTGIEDVGCITLKVVSNILEKYILIPKEEQKNEKEE